MATRFVNKVRLVFEVELSLKDFFEHPTISGVVSVIRRLQLSKKGNVQSLASILNEIEKLSDEDVLAELEEYRQDYK